MLTGTSSTNINRQCQQSRRRTGPILDVAPWGVAKKFHLLFNIPPVNTSSPRCGVAEKKKALEEHRQSSSKMTLFPFATQATERVPGASTEKPRVWVINLAAFELIVSVDRNEQYKQQ